MPPNTWRFYLRDYVDTATVGLGVTVAVVPVLKAEVWIQSFGNVAFLAPLINTTTTGFAGSAAVFVRADRERYQPVQHSQLLWTSATTH